MRLQLGNQLFLGHKADDPLHGLAVLKEDQGRDAHHAVPHGRFIVVIDVELGDLELPVVLGRDLFQRRGDHLAGTAPHGPKVHDGRQSCFEHHLVKGLICHFDRFGHGLFSLFEFCSTSALVRTGDRKPPQDQGQHPAQPLLRQLWIDRQHAFLDIILGNQQGQDFERQDGERFGIGATDEATWEEIGQAVWTGAQIKVWGTLYVGVPATEARQIQVEHLEILTGPAEDARDLTPFATSSASSHLPTDHGGQYQSFMAIDSALETAWVEGVSGSGVGEWLELQFPGTVEVHSIALDVGYDRDQDIFSANNRIKRATFIFSNGEQVTLDFSDSRGLQTIPLVRAPGPNVETTYVKVVIEEVFPGSKYDDTCLAEIGVWGRTR